MNDQEYAQLQAEMNAIAARNAAEREQREAAEAARAAAVQERLLEALDRVQVRR